MAVLFGICIIFLNNFSADPCVLPRAIPIVESMGASLLLKNLDLPHFFFLKKTAALVLADAAMIQAARTASRIPVSLKPVRARRPPPFKNNIYIHIPQADSAAEIEEQDR